MSEQDPAQRGDAALPHPPARRDAVAMRSHTTAERAALTRRVADLDDSMRAAEADLAAARKALEEDFARRSAELERRRAPLQAQLARISEISWTLDLYLGRDEKVTLLRDGSPAPASEPITIRQLVLAADEESLLLAEAGGIDYRRMDAFIGWVAADPANMARVIPDAKGVVVVVPSRQDRDYGNPVHNAYAEGQNSRAHWLLRNGEKLYLLVTDPELEVRDRLLPSRDEFISLFTDRWTGEPLAPGSDAWLQAEERAGRLQRHYMRQMLVLQGIVDRTVVWHPLPAPGLNLLTVAAQEAGHVRLVNETDMVLGDGRPRFREWQRALNRRLRPGNRVVLATAVSSWRSGRYDGDRYTRGGHERLTPPGASYPPGGVPLLIEDRRAGGLVIRYERTDEIWKRNVPVPGEPGYVYPHYPVPAARRASCLIYPDDLFVLPFDAASEEDLEYYLNSREDRRGYLDMVPVLRSALTAKKAEHAAEAGFRELLAGVILARHPDADPGELEAGIPALITWWKTGHMNARALTGDQAHETAAVETIAREWDLRRRHAGNPADNAAAAAAARDALGDRLLVVARTRDGQYKAWAPADPAGRGPWLTEHAITLAGASHKVATTAEWVTVHPRTLATMRVLHAGSRWDWWDLYPAAGEILTGPETDALARRLLDHMTAQAAIPIAITVRIYDDDYGRRQPARDITGYAWPAGADLTDLTRPGLDDYLACFNGTWTRERDGAVTITIRPGRPNWCRYTAWPQVIPQPADSDHVRDIGWPWRDPGSPHWDLQTSSSLIWHDPAQVSRVLSLHNVREQRRRDARQAEAQQANYQYAAQIRQAADRAWLREKTREARGRFDQDYGHGAGDLWAHHLATLALETRYKPPRWLDEMSRRLARARVPVDGKTFAQLARIDAGLHTGGGIDVGEWAGWVISMPASGDVPAAGQG